MKNETVKKVLLGMAMASPLALINSGNVHASSVSTNIETKWHANSLAIVQQELRNQNINPDYKITNAKYVVQAGDTLSQIAAATHINMYHIAAVNHIQNLNLIYVGQVLILNQGDEVAHNVAGNGSTTAASIGNTYTLRSASQSQSVLSRMNSHQDNDGANAGSTATGNTETNTGANSGSTATGNTETNTGANSGSTATGNTGTNTGSNVSGNAGATATGNTGTNTGSNVSGNAGATATGNAGTNTSSNVSGNAGSTANNSSSANTSVSGSVNTGSTQTPSASSQQPASSVSSSEQPVASSSATQGSESSTSQATGSNASSASQQTPSVSSSSQQTGVSSSSQQKQPVISSSASSAQNTSSSASSATQQTPSVSSSSQQTGVSSSTAQGSVSSSSQQSTTSSSQQPASSASSTSSASQVTSSSQTQGSVSSSQTTTSSSTQQPASSSQSSTSSSSQHSTTSSSSSKQPTSSASSASQSSATSSSQSSASSSSQSSASSSSQQKTVDGYTLDNMPLSVFNDKKNLDAINNTFSGDEIENYFNNHIGKGNMTWDEAQQAQQNGQVTSAILAWNGQMLPTEFNPSDNSANNQLVNNEMMYSWRNALPTDYLNNDSQKAQINKKYGDTDSNDVENATQQQALNDYCLSLINKYRESQGLPDATTDNTISQVTLNRANSYSASDLDHTGHPEGYSECLGGGISNGSSSMFDMMDSSYRAIYNMIFNDQSNNNEHRDILLNSSKLAFATRKLSDGSVILIVEGQ